ncbi:hypothetical protein ANCCAN_21213 [Ancylostoma caninum]|uniref:Uncharacterized protein n=1 Tax=Ancylostoma caninum TaxID=29170 RepID=A0A368FQ83_ANCCA|nr:hypothetical protein ANCCAN_21213 [Ancylostoma caninum]
MLAYAIETVFPHNPIQVYSPLPVHHRKVKIDTEILGLTERDGGAQPEEDIFYHGKRLIGQFSATGDAFYVKTSLLLFGFNIGCICLQSDSWKLPKITARQSLNSEDSRATKTYPVACLLRHNLITVHKEFSFTDKRSYAMLNRRIGAH